MNKKTSLSNIYLLRCYLQLNNNNNNINCSLYAIFNQSNALNQFTSCPSRLLSYQCYIVLTVLDLDTIRPLLKLSPKLSCTKTCLGKTVQYPKYLEFNFKGTTYCKAAEKGEVGASDISIYSFYGKFLNITNDVIDHSQCDSWRMWCDCLQLNALSALPVK